MMGMSAHKKEMRMSGPNGIDPTVAPSGTGCAECDEVGGWWVHLRRCAQCGHVGCCDTSPAQHATAHFRATGHPYVRSFEPGEPWYWDYRSNEMLDGPELAGPEHRPLDQTVPGPADRVPADWRDHIH
jgi:Zn-finger in ubiquitin-hydrolases and other protein